jgi:putative hydrolase of the HAD superfamily
MAEKDGGMSNDLRCPIAGSTHSICHVMRNQVRFVMFDAVGTLIRVQPSVAEVYWNVATRFGSKLTVEQIKDRFETSFARHQDGGPTCEERERERWQAIVSDVLRDISQFKEQVFEELWTAFARPEQWALFEEVPKVWKELRRRGLVLGIASNFDQRLRTICRGMPPLHDASHCFISSEIGFPKPRLEFFRHAECVLNAKPEEILLVGDSLMHDVEGARSAGWQALHVDRDGDQNGLDSIQTLGQLFERLP